MGGFNWRFSGDVRNEEVEDQVCTVWLCGGDVRAGLREGVSESMAEIPGKEGGRKGERARGC